MKTIFLYFILFSTIIYSREIQSTDKMKKNIEHEIIDLHQFFQDWFNAEIDNTEKEFARFSEVMADDFEIISPSGIRTVKNELEQKLSQAYGFRVNEASPFRIWIENIEVRQIEKELYISTYEEWQEIDGESKGRLSTALFKTKSDTPNGLLWLHVHETCLPEK